MSRFAGEIWMEVLLQACQEVCGRQGQQWPHLRHEHRTLSVNMGETPCESCLEEVLLHKQHGVWDQRGHQRPNL